MGVNFEIPLNSFRLISDRRRSILQIVSQLMRGVDLDVEAASVQSQTRRNPYERRKSIDEAIRCKSVCVCGRGLYLV